MVATRQQLKNKREKERKKKEQKKKSQKKLKDKLKVDTKVAGIPGVMYKGSGKDPAVNKLLDKLKKDGADSLDSSGMGTHWKV